MPRYDYRCEGRHQYELQQPFGSPTEHPCEKCGKPARRIVTVAPPIVFKAGGYYKTSGRDFDSDSGSSSSSSTRSSSSASKSSKSSSEKKSSKAKSSEASSSTSSTSSSSSSDAKPASSTPAAD